MSKRFNEGKLINILHAGELSFQNKRISKKNCLNVKEYAILSRKFK